MRPDKIRRLIAAPHAQLVLLLGQQRVGGYQRGFISASRTASIMTNLHRHAPLRVALVGLGTVGGGVIRLLQTNADLIARRAGCPIQIVAISARDRNKDRGVDLSPYEWVDDMTTLPGREDVDVVVELIGGADGPALTLARQCLAAGKPFVTAPEAFGSAEEVQARALLLASVLGVRLDAEIPQATLPIAHGTRPPKVRRSVDDRGMCPR